MKKSTIRLIVLFACMFASIALLNGRKNFEEACFMASHSEGTDLAISIEMARYGFDIDFMEEPTIFDYMYSGIFF